MSYPTKRRWRGKRGGGSFNARKTAARGDDRSRSMGVGARFRGAVHSAAARKKTGGKPSVKAMAVRT
ncbi:hypothetical protein AGMMS49959_06020 [Planctomycetales bacterium]|nr:hypothetical protein AGMMS49959_06020 [Planctomycetales bacterium]